jgi:hypothetical protein
LAQARCKAGAAAAKGNAANGVSTRLLRGADDGDDDARCADTAAPDAAADRRRFIGGLAAALIVGVVGGSILVPMEYAPEVHQLCLSRQVAPRRVSSGVYGERVWGAPTFFRRARVREICRPASVVWPTE